MTARHAKWQLALAAALLVALGTALLGEAVVRSQGYAPWPPPVPPTVEPGGRLFRADAALGYTHLPGRYTVTLPGGYRFQMTHRQDTLRVTQPAARYAGADVRPQVWVFGCSLTHGWSVNDDQTYVWQLQRRFPEYEFVNFGVNGYGTLHSLIQLRAALATRRPALVLLAYASFHDVRNTYLRQRRKETSPWRTLGPLRQPVARLDKAGRLAITMEEAVLTPFPLITHSALSHFLEQAYNRLEVALTPSNAVSRAIIAEMAAVARAHDVPFALGYIWERPFMDDLTAELGIDALDLAVDLTVPGNSNEPYDPHPSARAHGEYAARVATWIGAAEVPRSRQP